MFSVALLLLLAAGCVKCQQLTQPASVTVQPGQRLTITCQVSYSVSSYWTAWIRQPAGKGLEWITSDITVKNSLKNKFSINLDSSSNTVTLNGQNVQPEDSAVYYCARNNYGNFDYWGKGTMVTVTSATSIGPTAFPLMPCDVGSGNMVTLGCLATGFSPSSVTYSWSHNGSDLTDFIQYPSMQKGDTYTGISQIRVRREDWEANSVYRCSVAHAAGQAQCDFKPEVLRPQLPSLKVLASCDEEEEASFSCLAKDFSPKDFKIKWMKNEEEVTNKIEEFTTPPLKTNEHKIYSAASFLKVPKSEWTEGITFTCEFEGIGQNKNVTKKNDSVTFPLKTTAPDDIQVDITITGPEVEELFRTGKGSVECLVKANQASVEKIWWEDERKQEMADGSMYPARGHKGPFIVKLPITYEEWSKGIKRTCKVEHTERFAPFHKVYERNFGGQPQRPAVFMLPPIEHSRKETVTLTCFVKDFFPRDVFVSWLVDDEEVNTKFHTTEPVAVNGLYSAYGMLTLSTDQWKKNDTAYSCVVFHESLVNSTRSIVRSIEHRTYEKTNLFNLNMNIPETCNGH